MNESRWPAAAYAAAGVLFVLLATANSAGYRYGVSDQAFHVPAIVHAWNPATFPRDAALIESQSRLMLFDDGVATVVRVTGLSLETTFLLGYLLTTGLTWMGAVLIGQRVLGAPWAIVAFGAFLCMRHRIPRTSANSLEPYFYPRTLAFALGLLALAAIFRQRRAVALALVAAGAAVHITTGAWFAVLIGTAVVALDARRRRWLPLAAVVAVLLIGGSATAAGRLQPYLAPLDAEWLEGMGARDSLFPTDWPAWAWMANLGLPVALVVVHRVRLARHAATRVDTAIVTGALALVALFIATVPLVSARWALPTQLQISRVFWVVEFVTLLYAVALVAEWLHAGDRRRMARLMAMVALVLSVARGTFVMAWEHPDRRLFEVSLRPTPWTSAMAWLSQQPLDVHVLAHPAHATRYGSSVRVAARRDVVLEDNKDSAVALYSRDIAVRVATRRRDIGHAFHDLSTETARQLAERYDVDYLVTEGAPLAFPVAYSNARFRIYDVRAEPR